MNYLYHAYVSHNPSGIDINLGYYALAECLIKGTYPSIALSRWCDLKQDTTEYRHYKNKVVLDVDKLKQIYKDRFLTYANLSEITGKSRPFFSKMFCGGHKYYPIRIVIALEEGLGLKKGTLIKGECNNEHL